MSEGEANYFSKALISVQTSKCISYTRTGKSEQERQYNSDKGPQHSNSSAENRRYMVSL